MTFINFVEQPRRWTVCLASLAVAVLLGTANSAMADLEEVGFQVKISEKEMILEHPNDADYKMFAMWDTAYQRIRNRNMPWVEVENLSTAGNLTEFSLTIGDTDYNYTDAVYGVFALLSDSTPDVSITSSSTGDELFVTIGDGGLAPGEIVRFGIDLDPDAGVDGLFPHPDFRLVLFDMNGNDSSDNAIASAVFTDPDDVSLTDSLSLQLEDYEVTGNQALYYNSILRPYGVMEGIDTFGASVIGEPSTVPEPSSVALVGLALVGGAVWRRRRAA